MTATGPGVTGPRHPRLLLVGYGRMGRLVEALSADFGFDVVGTVRRDTAADAARWPEADVAVDFSIADAVPENVARLAARGVPVVVGTTGWQAHEARVRDVVAAHGTGVVVAPNFALGVNIFLAIAERAGALLAGRPEFGAWIHELHHAAKRDAPSGTAIALRAALEQAGYREAVDMASTRAGSIPGTHTVGFDSISETITLTHVARDRSGFARGALEAARWIQGRRGWFGMKDVLGI
jgi:4-hydroxy-tetrahydrodipicolinate reductase